MSHSTTQLALLFFSSFTLFSQKKMSIHPDTYVKLKKDRNTTVRSQAAGMTPTAWEMNCSPKGDGTQW